MCRPYGWVLGPKFSKQGSLFRQIFHKHGWAIQKLAKIAQNGSFSAKIHHNSGYVSKFRLLKEGTFLKTGRQTPVHPHVMPLPPGRSALRLQPQPTILTKVLGDKCDQVWDTKFLNGLKKRTHLNKPWM